MKTVILEGNELCGIHTGMQRFICETLLELDKSLKNENRLNVELVYPFYKNCNAPKFENIRKKPLYCTPSLYKKLMLPNYIKFKKAIYCGLANNWPILNENIICLHDTIASKNEFGFSLEERNERLEKYKAIANQAQVILTVSNTSKQEIIKDLNVDSQKIVVVYNGWEHMKKIKSDDTIFQRQVEIKKKEYIYALGSIMPHKNFKWIIEVAKRNPQYQFVIAGNKHELGQESFDIDNVLYLGYVTDEENKALMEECMLFVQPSKMEGFGIPPLEALACGAKVAVSNASCLPEIYEDCVVYFDPDKYDVDIKEVISRNVEDPQKLFSKYSWKKAASLVLDSMLKLAKSEG